MAKPPKPPAETPTVDTGLVVQAMPTLPWDRWPAEPVVAHEVFKQWLAAGWTQAGALQARVTRTHATFRSVYGKTVVWQWRREWQWDARAAAYDAWMDRQAEASVGASIGQVRLEVARSLADGARALAILMKKALGDAERGRALPLDKLSRIALEISRAAETIAPTERTAPVVVNVHPDLSEVSDEELARQLTEGGGTVTVSAPPATPVEYVKGPPPPCRTT